MKLFVTGGSGFIGSALVDELINNGHQVLALARSDKAADQLTKAGAEVIRGELEDYDIWKKATKETDGVLHLGFIHDFDNIVHSFEIDFQVTKAIIDELVGTDKLFIYTTGLLTLVSDIGVESYETDRPVILDPKLVFNKRIETELHVLDSATKGIRSIVMRLSPSVHGAGDHGFVPMLMKLANDNKTAYYVDEGKNTWPCVHRKDAAVLYRLAAEKGFSGSAYHAASENLETKRIAEAIGKKLDVPMGSIESSKAHEKLGMFGALFAKNACASTEKTKKDLGWVPKEVDLIQDILDNY